VLDDLAEHPAASLLAGGMSLLPLIKLELAQPSRLIDLGRVEGLSGVREENDAIWVGAMTPHHLLAAHPLVTAHIPVLAQAASRIGDPQVRHRGTIGGSLAHADPAADLPAAVLAADAVMEARSVNGTREIPAADFFVGPLATALYPEEVLVAIRFPKENALRQSYQKIPHPASGYAVVGVAVSLALAGDMVRAARIAVAGVGSHPYRAFRAETVIAGGPLDTAVIEEAVPLVTEGQEVLGDAYASAAYRRHLAEVAIRRVLSALVPV